MLNNFYADKTILITGATGFLGKVVLEKILRDLPNIKCVYLAIADSVSTTSQGFKQQILI